MKKNLYTPGVDLDSEEVKTSPIVRGKTPVAGLMDSSILKKSEGKQQRKYHLPVSKNEVMMSLMALDTEKTFPSALNPRNQKLLSLDDEKVASIRQSMLVNGQAEPVYARPVNREGGVHYEVYVGTTRCFCAADLNETQENGFKLLAWVSDKVGDADAAMMAREENDKRRDLSIYEKALDIAASSKSAEYRHLSLREFSARLGFSHGYMSKMTSISEIPEYVISKVKSISDISVRQGVRVSQLYKDASELDEKKFKNYINTMMPVSDANRLIKEISSFIYKNNPRKDEPSKMVEETIETANGKVIAKLVPHRTDTSRSKLELYGVSKNTLNKLLALLKKEE